MPWSNPVHTQTFTINYPETRSISNIMKQDTNITIQLELL